VSRRKKAGKSAAGRRPQRRGTVPRPHQPAEPTLEDRIDAALASDQPLDVLTLASGLMNALDPRSADPFEARRGNATLPEFAQALIEQPRRPTSALLAVIAALTDDDVLKARVNRELSKRSFPIPDGLIGLSTISPYRVVNITDDLGDGEEIIIGARLATGEPITASVFVDHNLGTVVKDAFVIAVPVEGFLEAAAGHDAFDEDVTIGDLDPAAARARLAEAIEQGARVYPPYETDHWPSCRPIVEWLCRGLPHGGAGYDFRQSTATDRATIADRFFASPFGRGVDGPDERALLDDVLWYGTDYSTGDPHRWSVPKVEVLMLDWVPRKIVADNEYLARLPELLKAYVEFAHGEAGIRARLTVETADAIDEFTAKYLEIIGKPRLQGPAALLAQIGIDDPGESSLAELERAVGGADALQTLDDAPLPDEDFDWAGISDGVAGTVEQVLAHLDDVLRPRSDIEYLTACRRLLRRIAVEAPEVLGRRNAKANTTAAAIAWLIGQANDLFDRYGADAKQVKAVLADFGVASASQRARVFMKAIGVDDRQYNAIDLGDPRLLVASQRSRICEIRDSLVATKP
jgi:hypothetical protein